MVSLRCKMMVKEELNKLGLKFFSISLGQVELMEKITGTQREQMRVALLHSGLELMDDKKSILIEKIKDVIIEMVHYEDELPKVNFSDYLDSAGFGMVNGVVVDDNRHRNPSVILKAGFDKQLTAKIRLHLSGSLYHNSSNANNGLTLYGGDRGGSNYQDVIEKWHDAAGAVQSSTSIAFSGRYNPGFTKRINAVLLNGFIKAGGLELFGTYETAKGRSLVETSERKASQFAGDIVYRFGPAEKFFTGARYNAVKAVLPGITQHVKLDRTALSAGYFMTRNILMKGEYVVQHYKDFPTTDYRNGGKFSGFVIEAVVGF